MPRIELDKTSMAVRHCVPKPPDAAGRQELAGIRVEGTCCVATNGKVLAVVEHRASELHSYLPSDAAVTVPVDAARAATGKKTITVDTQAREIEAGGAVYPVQEAKYPDWRFLTDGRESNRVATVHVETLEALIKVAKQAGLVTVDLHVHDGAIRLLSNTPKDMRSVTMISSATNTPKPDGANT